MSNPNLLDDRMTATLNGNLVRYAVSRAIFCPGCESILDCRRAVLILDRIVCERCFARYVAGARPQILEALVSMVGTYDVLRGSWFWTGCGRRRTMPSRRDSPETLVSFLRSRIPLDPED